jgi:hypothetical protein
VTRLRCTRRRCEAHRVAISNHRLIAFENDQFTFRWKDYRCASSYSARRPTELIPPKRFHSADLRVLSEVLDSDAADRTILRRNHALGFVQSGTAT